MGRRKAWVGFGLGFTVASGLACQDLPVGNGVGETAPALGSAECSATDKALADWLIQGEGGGCGASCQHQLEAECSTAETLGSVCGNGVSGDTRECDSASSVGGGTCSATCETDTSGDIEPASISDSTGEAAASELEGTEEDATTSRAVVDACSDPDVNDCDAHATCSNLPDGAGFLCSCDPGWTGDGFTCVDSDECSDPDANDCDAHATCSNLPDGAGFLCSCNPGWAGNGVSCADANGCLGAPCYPGVACTDVPAPGVGFSCGACPEGYEGDGQTCSKPPQRVLAYYTFDAEDQFRNTLGDATFDSHPVAGGSASITEAEGEHVRGGGALRLDSGGVSSRAAYVEVTGNLLGEEPQGVSIAGWYRYDDVNGDGSAARTTLLDFHPPPGVAAGPLQVALQLDPLDDERDFEWIWSTTSGAHYNRHVGPVVNDSRWHHAVLTWNRDTASFAYFHDGRRFDTGRVADSTLVSSSGFRMGSSAIQAGADCWDGFLDDVAIFNFELNSDQAWALFTGDATPLSVADAIPTNASREPIPFVEGSWSMVVVPDTQYYSRSAAAVAVLDEMLEWIAANQETRRIQVVLQAGDNTDDNLPEQWFLTRESYRRLDGAVPYVLATGNHDYEGGGRANDCYRCTRLNQYFSQNDSAAATGVLAPNELQNAYYEFVAPDGRKMLIVSLEWAPRAEVVTWANQVVTGSLEGMVAGQYDDHTAVLLTHAYLYRDNLRYDWTDVTRSQEGNPHDYSGTLASDHDGQQLWNALVAPNPSFHLAFSGHVVGNRTSVLDGEGYLRSAVTGTDHDHVVHEALFDSQVLPNGGNGWLLLIEFLPDGKSALLKTYSPYLDSWRQETRLIDW